MVIFSPLALMSLHFIPLWGRKLFCLILFQNLGLLLHLIPPPGTENNNVPAFSSQYILLHFIPLWGRKPVYRRQDTPILLLHFIPLWGRKLSGLVWLDLHFELHFIPLWGRKLINAALNIRYAAVTFYPPMGTEQKKADAKKIASAFFFDIYRQCTVVNLLF